MPYNNNTPLPNEAISDTTDPIRNNFAFIQTDLQVDHSFNGNSPAAEGTHLQTSMRNRADPIALPTGTNGTYYVGAGVPKFYNGAVSFIQTTTIVQTSVSGSVALNGSAGAYQTLITLPQNAVGTVHLFLKGTTGTNFSYVFGNFASSTNGIQYNEILNNGLYDLNMTGLNFQAKSINATPRTVTFIFVYWTP